MRTPLIAVLLALFAAPGCEAEPPRVLSSTGYVPLVLDPAEVGLAAGDVLEVRIGGILALQPTPVDGGLQVLVQGAPQPGPAQVVITPRSGDPVVHPARLEYAPPLDPAFDRVVAFGASLTQGVQDAVPTFDGTLQSPALILARALGAYMPQPQLVPGLFDTLPLESVGPPPECEPADVVDHITAGMAATLPRLARPYGGGFGYEIGRVDPGLEIRNLAAGNYQLDDTVHGPEESEIVQIFLGHLSFDPYGTFGRPPQFTQLDAVEALEPTLILSTDFLGNDALGGTPAAPIADDLALLVPRLAATGAEVFLAEVPDITVLPGRIGDPNPDTRELVIAYNAALRAEADAFANVHVVPLFDAVNDVVEDGLQLAGEVLDIGIFGGLLSFDGLHFSATGYALVAQEFADTIGATLGVEIPPIPMADIFASDIHAPPAIRAAGRDPDACVIPE